MQWSISCRVAPLAAVTARAKSLLLGYSPQMGTRKELVEELRALLDEEKERHVYHVTYSKHLAGIAQHGLQPGRGQSMGHGGGTEHHSKKRVFTTSPEGVSFWHGRAADHAHDRSDDPHKSGHTPVVVRAKVPKGHRLTKDDIGTKDAGGAPAHHSKKGIGPEHLHVFHNGEWHPIADHHKVDTKASYDHEGYHKADHENPSHPKPEHLGQKKSSD